MLNRRRKAFFQLTCDLSNQSGRIDRPMWEWASLYSAPFSPRSIDRLSTLLLLNIISLIWALIDFSPTPSLKGWWIPLQPSQSPWCVRQCQTFGGVWWMLAGDHVTRCEVLFFIFPVLSSRAAHHSGCDLFVSHLHGYCYRLQLTLVCLHLCGAASLFPSFRFGFCLLLFLFFLSNQFYSAGGFKLSE